MDLLTDIESTNVYKKMKRETERYMRENTLLEGDIERYGFGKNILKMLLSGLAMHAVSHLIGSRGGNGGAEAATPSTPSTGLFAEDKHPRESLNAGTKKAGQFAAKPGAGQDSPQPSAPKDPQPKQQALPVSGNQQPAPAPPAPMDHNTARVAEIWHGKKEPDLPSPSPLVKRLPMGNSHATLGMHNAEHSDMHSIGRAMHQGTSDDTINQLANDYAYSHGVDLDTIQKHALATFHANRGQAQNIQPGEHRDLKYTPFSQGANEPAQDAPQLQPQRPGGPAYEGADAASSKFLFPSAEQETSLAPEQDAPQNDNRDAKIAAQNQATKNLLNRNWRGPLNPLGPSDPEQKPEESPAPRNYPDNLNKPPEQQANYAPPDRTKGLNFDAAPAEDKPEPSIKELMHNPAWHAKQKKDAEAAEAARKQAEIDESTKFDPADFAGEQEERVAPKKVKLEDFTKRDAQGKVIERDHAAADAARKQRRNEVRNLNYAQKKEQKDNPDQHVQNAMAGYELHSSFRDHINEMEKHEQGQWSAREKMKSAIKKAWGINAGDAASMENKYRDRSSLKGEDQLTGNIPQHDINEHLGYDEHGWAENAWNLIREAPQPKPGRHDPEWVDKHAEQFKSMQGIGGDYDPDPPHEEDRDHDSSVPFSRRALDIALDRYFRKAMGQFRQVQHSEASRIWTDLDAWL